MDWNWRSGGGEFIYWCWGLFLAAFHVVTRIDASGKGKQKSKFSLMKLKVVKKRLWNSPDEVWVKVLSEVILASLHVVNRIEVGK